MTIRIGRKRAVSQARSRQKILWVAGMGIRALPIMKNGAPHGKSE
jgi:hypothetical protein